MQFSFLQHPPVVKERKLLDSSINTVRVDGIIPPAALLCSSVHLQNTMIAAGSYSHRQQLGGKKKKTQQADCTEVNRLFVFSTTSFPID